jgi:hypothetical protein
MGRSIDQEGGIEVPWMGRNWRTTVAETADSGEQFWQPGGTIKRERRGKMERDMWGSYRRGRGAVSTAD